MRPWTSLSTMMVGLCLALSPAAALAKKKPVAPKDEEPAKVEPAKTEPEKAEPAKSRVIAAESAQSGGDDTPAAGGEASTATKPVKGGAAGFARIADDEETIYAVQRKAYLVKGKVELTPMFAATFADRFVQMYAPAASLSYHIAENFGVEVHGAYVFPSEADLTTEILEKGMLTPEVAKLTQMLWAGGVGVQWSPIYGKLQLFGASLGNFSVYLGAGVGIGQTRVQCVAGTELDPNRGFAPGPDGKARCPAITNPRDTSARVFEPARTQFMGSVAGGVRFYFSDKIGLKFELRDWVFATRVFRPAADDSTTQRFTDAIRNNIFAQVGLSFLFGGEE